LALRVVPVAPDPEASRRAPLELRERAAELRRAADRDRPVLGRAVPTPAPAARLAQGVANPTRPIRAKVREDLAHLGTVHARPHRPPPAGPTGRASAPGDPRRR